MKDNAHKNTEENATPKPEKIKQKVAVTAATATGYMFSVAAAYNHGYWGIFDVNVLQFMSISDFTRLAIWPAVAFVIPFALGFISRAVSVKKEPERARTIKLGIIKGVMAGLIFSSAIVNEPSFWIFASLILGVFVSIVIARHFEIKTLNDAVSSEVIFLATMIIFGTWGYARSSATELLLETDYVRAIVSSSVKREYGIQDTQELKFLANTESDYLLMINGTRKILVIPHEKLAAVTLERIGKKNTYRPVVDWFLKLIR